MQATPPATVVFQLAPAARKPIDWASAWPDAIAFVAGLAVARWAGWTAGDLIWSLWLSSLVVGYTTIVWTIGHPAAVLTVMAWRSRNLPTYSGHNAWIGFIAIVLVGVAFLLAFFTLHFGGFHFIHSGFLLSWFPLDAPGVAETDLRGKAAYLEVLRRYWIFLPSAFLSHRAVFMSTPLTLDAERWLKSLVKKGKTSQAFFVAPYANVVRLHLLIFFFGFAHWAQLENFAVYAGIYVAYFFPWRLLRRDGPAGRMMRS
jgi:hypothetical protein